MRMFEAFKLFFSRATDFKGRTSRREFWLGVLPNAIIMVVLLGLLIFGLTCLGVVFNWFSTFMLFLFIWFCLVEILPSVSLIIRRMHDIGKSGYYIFILFIPIAGFIWYIYLVTRETDYYRK